MDHAIINKTDIKITKIGFGCANFGGIGSDPKLVGKGDTENDAHQILNIAYDFGINYFDTAATYGNGNSEEIIGSWLNKNKISRDSIVLSSKVSKKNSRFSLNKKGLSYSHILKQIKGTLKRLNTDYLDLFYIHAPDPATPIIEILNALNDCVMKGLTRSIGISNVSLDYLKESIEISRKNSFAEYSVVQNSYNYLQRDDENDLIPYCKDNKILYVGYSPLAGGILTGKYQPGVEYPDNTRLSLREYLYKDILSEENVEKINTLKRIAEQKKITLTELIYMWLYKNSNIDSFLIGARKIEQFQPVKDILKIELNIQDYELINNLYK